MLISLDTETHLIKRGMKAPGLICLSSYDGTKTQLLNRKDALDYAWSLLLFCTDTIITHNGSYDFGVLCAEDPNLIPHVFKAYRDGAIRDTFVRQKLVDIARGEHKIRITGSIPAKSSHSLAALAQHWLGITLQKEDTYRLRYAELRDLPISSWPEAAKDYAIGDARTTLQIYLAQPQEIANELPQTLHAWVLHLMSVWGVRTDATRIPEVVRRLQEIHSANVKRLQVSGLIRSDNTQNTKAVQAKVSQIYTSIGLDVPMTTPTAKFPRGQISTKKQTLEETGDPDLMLLAEDKESSAARNTWLKALKWGTDRPLCPRYNVLVETGRTSCGAHKEKRKPVDGANLQNPPKVGGIRECFIPLPGNVYVGADYPSAELRGLAQVHIDLFGHSSLADQFRRGEDPIINFAARLMGIPRDEAYARYKAKDPIVVKRRQESKAALYGFPGGMGAKKFVLYARGMGLNISLQESETLRAIWFQEVTEAKDYFAFVSNITRDDIGTMTQLRSGRVRGGVYFSQCANSYFQGLLADMSKDALSRVSYECYCIEKSPLFNARPVIFPHDEIILEAREDRAARAAERLSELMVDAGKTWLPDVPVFVEPFIMRRWSKKAEPVRDAYGALIPWEEKPTIIGVRNES